MAEDRSDHVPPRFYANNVNLAIGGFDATLTFLEHDGTALPPDQDGPHEARAVANVQVVMSVGGLKAMIPLLVKAISQYEQNFGVVPAPGFDEESKS